MKKILLGLVVCAGMCACTNDDVVVNNPATNYLDGDSYISVAINLPTTTSTRANDDFDDGLASEYAVNDISLLLFQGASEEAATCYATYKVTDAGWTKESPDNSNVTTRQKFVQQISAPSGSNELYVLVVLNDNGMSGAIAGGYEGKTLHQLQSTAAQFEATTDLIDSDGYIYMTNAPLISVAGGTTAPTDYEVTTLAHIEQSNIFGSKSAAEAATATEIYVERGVAKVTMASVSDSYTVDEVSIAIDGFVLDNTNLVTYPVRNTTTDSAEGSQSWWGLKSASSDVNDYRFAGSSAVDAAGYRTYWAVDPNYDVAPVIGQDMYSAVSDESVSYGELGDENPQYCLENTFNVAHMNQNETTRAIVKATANNGEAFYMWDGASLVYDEEGITNVIENAFAANEDVIDALKSYISEDDFYVKYVTVTLPTEASDDAEFAVVLGTLDSSDFVDGQIPDAFQATGLADINSALNAANTLAYYEDGVCYYAILIRHFDDNQTPWSSDAVTAETVTEGVNSSYPGNAYGSSETPEADWLGRYGVLRNNWYDISVTGISKIGTATPPEATGIPDDPLEQWISYEINILSWAKRTQSVTL